jgi:Xaa-Pro aminopeptidase
MFDAAIHAGRRHALCRRLGGGLVLLLGNEESPINYAGNPYPFRQDSSFLYFVGLDQPGLAAVIDADEGHVTVFGDDLTLDDIVWTGPLPTLAERCAEVGIKRTRPAQALAEAVGDGRRVHVLPPYRAGNTQRLARLLDLPLGAVRDAVSEELIRAVVDLRSVKSEEEIAEIERAVDVTAEMQLAAMRLAAPGRTEAELAAEVQHAAGRAGCRHSFPAILTVHGEILHNHGYPNVLESGRLVVCDCGAETDLRYAGDMTRTFPVDPAFTTRQREIYEVVLAAENAVIAALRPGVPYRECHLLAARTIAEGLGAIGLMRGDPTAAVAAGAHALFFPHGLGHMMGLDVHDMEDLGEDHVGYGEGFARSDQFGLKWLRLARKLEPGFVLTVEPGVYFIPELIGRWRAEGLFAEFVDYGRLEGYLDFGGVRIEEDFLITPDGARRLGKPAPKSVAEVEALRAGDA